MGRLNYTTYTPLVVSAYFTTIPTSDFESFHERVKRVFPFPGSVNAVSHILVLAAPYHSTDPIDAPLAAKEANQEAAERTDRD